MTVMKVANSTEKPCGQFTFRNKHYVFAFSTKFFLFILPVVILCVFLGNWQLHRYHYKIYLLTTFHQRLLAPAKPIALDSHLHGTVGASGNELQFQHVMVTGDYRNDLTAVVQNQFYHDQLGFEVLTPLRVAGEDKLLLVDRGWVKALTNQSVPLLPPAKNVNGSQTVKGYIKLINEYQFTLGKNILNPTVTPIVMQKIDVKELSMLTHHTFYPFIVRLDQTEPNGFIRDWTITTVLPQRHMAYAVQWYAMAIALLLAFLFFCCQRVEDK